GIRTVWDEMMPVIKREVREAFRSLRDSSRAEVRPRVRKRRRMHIRRGRERLPSTPSVEQLVELHNHGVDAEFVRELRTLGLDDLSMDDVVELSDHGVTPTVVREFRTAGLPAISADELVELIDHGVEPGLAQGLHGL